jgi:hypothetical protein
LGIALQETGARGAQWILSLIESESMLSRHGVNEASYQVHPCQSPARKRDQECIACRQREKRLIVAAARFDVVGRRSSPCPWVSRQRIAPARARLQRYCTKSTSIDARVLAISKLLRSPSRVETSCLTSNPVLS